MSVRSSISIIEEMARDVEDGLEFEQRRRRRDVGAVAEAAA